VLLRSYSGLFTEFVKINEDEIARRTDISGKEVEEQLTLLEKFDILTYQKKKNKPQIIFITERLDSKNLLISDDTYKNRKTSAETRLQYVFNYVQNDGKCRSQQLLKYFDEEQLKRCGKCDVCIERNKIELSELDFTTVVTYIKPALQQTSLTLEEIAALVPNVNEDKVIRVIQWLLDNDKLGYDNQRKLLWNK
jgi:ATP-dependent DNA helicase RecQ